MLASKSQKYLVAAVVLAVGTVGLRAVGPELASRAYQGGVVPITIAPPGPSIPVNTEPVFTVTYEAKPTNAFPVVALHEGVLPGLRCTPLHYTTNVVQYKSPKLTKVGVWKIRVDTTTATGKTYAAVCNIQVK